MKKQKEIEVKKDCFAYNRELENCIALTELVCKNKKCSFYKTKKQLREETEY